MVDLAKPKVFTNSLLDLLCFFQPNEASFDITDNTLDLRLIAPVKCPTYANSTPGINTRPFICFICLQGPVGTLWRFVFLGGNPPLPSLSLSLSPSFSLSPLSFIFLLLQMSNFGEKHPKFVSQIIASKPQNDSCKRRSPSYNFTLSTLSLSYSK